MSKVAKAALGLMVATLIAKILGFGREVVLASVYGATNTSDAFLVAMSIPSVIFLAVGTSLDTAFIPIYHDVEAKNGKRAGNRYTNNVLNTVILICLAISVIGLIFTPTIVKIFAIGFEGEVFAKSVYFTRVTLLGLSFLGMSYIMTAYLQVKGNFTVPGLMTVPNNIMIILSIILSYKINEHLLPWGGLFGLFLQFLFQYPYAKKHGFKYRPFVNFKDPALKRMLILILPVLVGVGVNQISTIVNRTIGSTLGSGSISALNYAYKLNIFVQGMFITSISSVIYPMLSRLSTEKNKKEFNKSIRTSVNTVMLLIIPISVGAIILAHPIVSILFKRGAFDAKATETTAVALSYYSIGLVGLGLRDILGKVFYALHDTKTPMKNSIITIFLTIALNLIFVNFTDMGVAGLAFSTSIAAIVTIILFFRSLKKKLGKFGGKSIALVTIKSILSSVLMAVVTSNVYKILSNSLGDEKTISQIIALGGAVSLGAIVYGICIIFLKVREVNLIIDGIKGKIKRS